MLNRLACLRDFVRHANFKFKGKCDTRTARFTFPSKPFLVLSKNGQRYFSKFRTRHFIFPSRKGLVVCCDTRLWRFSIAKGLYSKYTPRKLVEVN